MCAGFLSDIIFNSTFLDSNHLFKYSVDSIADEYFDDSEYNSFSNALKYKDISYINDHKKIREGQESNIRQFSEKVALETFETVNKNTKTINELDMIEDLVSKVNGVGDYKDISAEDRRKAKNTLTDLKDKAFPIEYKGTTVPTYRDLLNEDDTLDLSSNLRATINQLETDNEQLAIDLGKRKKFYL